ncbi:MAG: helix-turn-helix domain-containing protein [Thermaerobacter sp.]|nr:helix-turn-helix domain-containing protein [Thermaerobacter sp.]
MALEDKPHRAAEAALHNEHCPVALTARLIGDPYILMIVRDLANGTLRFGSLSDSVSVNPRTLTARLRRMEQDGLVVRHMFAEIPPRVEYTLTDKGRALLPVVEALRAYGDAWLVPPV